MASALDAVLQYKTNEQAQQKAQSDSILQATQLFQQARQQALSNQLAMLQYKAGLAEKGLVQDSSTSSGFKRDTSLMSSLDLLLQQGKAAEAQKNIVEAGGPNLNIFGGSNIPTNSPVGQVLAPANPISQPIQSANQTVAQGGVEPLIADKINSMGVPTSYLNPTAERKKNELDIEKSKQEEIVKGPAEAAVGKIALANESLKNIEDIKNTLFPDGTPQSFDRKVAFQSNTPNIKVPVIGQVGPSYIPTEKGQDVFRKMGASLSARQLIQTGVAARPEETQKLVDQFAPNVFSNPEATLKGLDELQSFYKDYLKNSVPEKRLKNDGVTNGVSPFQVGQSYNGEKIKSVKRIK